jgi:hypothetical protein
MGKKFFRVSYEIITHESAEHGDAEERGFVLPGEWREPVETKEDVNMGLRDAMRLAHPQEDSGSWWQEVDGREDYATGAREYRAIHPPQDITAASYARVSRILFKNQ